MRAGGSGMYGRSEFRGQFTQLGALLPVASALRRLHPYPATGGFLEISKLSPELPTIESFVLREPSPICNGT